MKKLTESQRIKVKRLIASLLSESGAVIEKQFVHLACYGSDTHGYNGIIQITEFPNDLDEFDNEPDYEWKGYLMDLENLPGMIEEEFDIKIKRFEVAYDLDKNIIDRLKKVCDDNKIKFKIIK